MSKRRDVLTGEYFILGDYACAEGAIAAGCRFFAGYPITPATEIAERMAQRLPEVNGIYIQMEDELASMAAILGASCAGVKSMTATSGPGFSLMVENLGLGVMLEVPTVVVNIMRGAPSTGLPTLVGQADVMQAKWGSHGDYEIIAYSPSTVQEMFDFTIKAFNASEKYRVPVVILSDESVGHLTEKLVIPPPEEIELIERPKPTVPPEEYLPYRPNGNGVPPMALAGEGYAVHMTGLTHDERGYPVITGEAHEKLVRRLIDKIRKNIDDIVEYEEIMMEDAQIAVVSYGITARSALRAVRDARKKGIKAGLFRLITVWPFPEKRIAYWADKLEAFCVAEINAGQIAREVERCARNGIPVTRVNKMGGDIITPEEILEELCQTLKLH
jgi:2-oxoglutarate ferredoxin oxidoreductase subunit alpha